MPSFATLAYWEMLILLGGFFGIVFWKLFTQQISLKYLLWTDDPTKKDAVSFSPGRAQLLTFTVLFAVHYLAQVIQNPSAFPPVSQEWLAVLGGSSGIYAAGKVQTLLFPRLGNLTRRGP